MADRLHPAFDPVARVWFLDDGIVESSTLRELQARFPKAKIVGYCPKGFKGNPGWEPFSLMSTRPTSLGATDASWAARVHRQKRKRPMPRTYEQLEYEALTGEQPE